MADSDLCYVRLAERGASAAMVINGTAPTSVAKFIKSNSGSTLEVMTVERAREMLGEYVAWKKLKQQKS